jgi:FkbM family methyltransferase
MYNYIVDWEEFNLIKDYVKPGDHVADVGSNIGYYTIWMSKFVGESGVIHAFEPDEKNFANLKNNCELNSLSNVSLNKAALSDRNGKLLFTDALDGENHISLSRSHNVREVDSLTFDAYCSMNGVKNLSYVKVDIEGFELFFLKGSKAMLSGKLIDILQLELNNQVKNSSTSIEDILKEIERLGYKLCSYNTDIKKIESTQYRQERENYLAVSDIDLVNKRLRA